MDSIYAVVLAGDNEDRKVKQGSVVPNKAFMNINERRMVDYVLDCYRSMNELAGVAIVGPEEKLGDIGNDVTVIPQRKDMIANVVAAAETIKAGWLLLSSCDIPLITPEAVRDFLSKCTGAELYYPLVSRAACEQAFPDMRRTWVHLKDGIYTGGNVFLVKTSKVHSAAGPTGAFFDARKSTAKLASLIGVSTLAKLVLHTLTIREVEEKMSNILGLKGKAVITNYPEIGTDVDKESDYQLISAQLKIAR